MQITICPSCGGRVRSESIGWKCENCQGFIDMRGEFHPHKEKPFMPPMTNADKLRSASGEELAKRLTMLFYQVAQETNAEHYILSWLRQPAEGDR